MSKNKILVNSAIITEDWKKYIVGGVIKVGIIIIGNIIWSLLTTLSAVIWFISLGHINFLSLAIKQWDKFMESEIRNW